MDTTVTESELTDSTIVFHPDAEDDPAYPYYREQGAVDNGVATFITVCGPILMVTGSVANALAAVVVLKSSAIRDSSAGVFMLTLSLVDTVLLDFGLIDLVLYAQARTELRSYTTDSCRTVIFLLSWLKLLDSWLVINMCLERFLYVFIPQVYVTYQWFGKGKAILGVIVTSVGSFGLSLVYAATLQTYDYLGESACDGMDRHRGLVRAWYWVEWSLSQCVPVLLLGGYAVVMASHMCYVRANRRQLQVTHNVKVSSVTATVLVLALIYTVLSTPLTILSPVTRFSSAARSTLNVTLVFETLWYFNCAVRFYVYCASHRKFGAQLRALMKQWCALSSGRMDSRGGRTDGVAHPGSDVRLSVYKKGKTVIDDSLASVSTYA